MNTILDPGIRARLGELDLEIAAEAQKLNSLNLPMNVPDSRTHFAIT
jgi:hypothetical protein